jgi:hypothetical protein
MFHIRRLIVPKIGQGPPPWMDKRAYATNMVEQFRRDDLIRAVLGRKFVQRCGNTASRRNPPGDLHSVDLKVRLETTQPHFGGRRWWFLCPLYRKNMPCERRVRKLYRPPLLRYFGCRSCLDLTYRSVQEHDKRIDELIKHPWKIPALVESKDPRKSLLALQACAKIYKWY